MFFYRKYLIYRLFKKSKYAKKKVTGVGFTLVMVYVKYRMYLN